MMEDNAVGVVTFRFILGYLYRHSVELGCKQMKVGKNNLHSGFYGMLVHTVLSFYFTVGIIHVLPCYFKIGSRCNFKDCFFFGPFFKLI